MLLSSHFTSALFIIRDQPQQSFTQVGFMLKKIFELHNRSTVAFWCGLLNFCLAIICLGLLLTDHRLAGGEWIWGKPLKYAFSVFITLWTIGWMLQYLRSEKIKKLLGWSLGMLATLKVVLIMVQSAKGEESHFNFSNPTSALIASSIVLADFLWLGAMIFFTYQMFSQKKMPLSQHYTWGVRMGMLNFCVLAIAGILMHLKMSHLIGSIPNKNDQHSFWNWSNNQGDLRIAHFFGVHSLQIIPLMSYYLFSKKNQVVTFSLLYLLFGLIVMTIALLGAPLF